MSVEEMIRNTRRPTLWLTKVHYLGMKHYQTATMTGVGQHGVFLVENGRVVEDNDERPIMDGLKSLYTLHIDSCAPQNGFPPEPVDSGSCSHTQSNQSVCS